MKRFGIPFLILLTCVTGAAYLIRNPSSVDEVSMEIIPVSVRVAEVELTSVDLIIGSQGKVQAAQTASLSAAVAGPVEWIAPNMEAGGFVREGDVLLRLQSDDYETVRLRSEAALSQANAESQFATREYERMIELAADRLASQSQLQDSQRVAQVALARKAEAEANYNQAQLDVSRAEIRSPFNAIVNSREVELGQYVNRAQGLAVLFGADEVEVRVPLAIRQLGFLDIPLGFRGELSTDEAPEVAILGTYGGLEHRWSGKLVRIEASIDANSNTVQTIIRVQQPLGESLSNAVGSPRIPLPIGLYVNASIEGKTVENLVALPRSVIRNNNQVLIVDAENKMYYREVEIFRLEEQQVLISGGLFPGERICISPIQAVIEGMSVIPVVEVI